MIKEFVIALLLSAAVATILLSGGSDLNNSFVGSSVINSTYSNVDYGSDDTRELMTTVSDKAPGGNSSNYGSGSTSLPSMVLSQ